MKLKGNDTMLPGVWRRENGGNFNRRLSTAPLLYLAQIQCSTPLVTGNTTTNNTNNTNNNNMKKLITFPREKLNGGIGR